MLSTHVLAGGVLGLVFSVFTPYSASLLVMMGMIFSTFPDLDVLFEHRKTFHRPFQYSLLFLLLLFSLFFYQSLVLTLLTAGIGSITLHSISEIFSQGRNLGSGGKNEKAVFNHPSGSWIEARDLVRVGGRLDLLLSLLLFIPLFMAGSLLVKIAAGVTIFYGSLHYIFNSSVKEEFISIDKRFH